MLARARPGLKMASLDVSAAMNLRCCWRNVRCRKRSRLRRARLANRPLTTDRGPITLTWSVGVSEGRPDDTVDRLPARADAAIYDAKQTGRNRVVARPGLIKSPELIGDAAQSSA